VIPIIGQTRSWRTIQFSYQPLLKPPLIASPHTPPTVVGYQLGIIAMRSDDLPVQSSCAVDLSKIQRDPFGTALAVMQQLVVNLETFRTCPCLPNAPCATHALPPAAEKES